MIYWHQCHKTAYDFDSEQNQKLCNSVQLCPTIDPSSIFWQVHIISNKKKRKTFYSQGLEDHGKEGWTGVWYPQFKSRYLVSTSTSLKYENSTVRTLTSQCLLLSAQWGKKIYDFLIKFSGKSDQFFLSYLTYLNLVLIFFQNWEFSCGWR